MPYRGLDGVSWQPVELRLWWFRTLAVLVLVMSGWGVGFLAGRMSAWLFPVDGPRSASVQTVSPSGPGAPVARPPSAAPAVDGKVKVTPAQPATSPDAPAARKSLSPQMQAAVPPKTVDSANASTSVPLPSPDSAQQKEVREPDAQPERRGVLLVQPEWTSADPQVRRSGRSGSDEGAGEVDEAALQECERRYASFRRSDGTYQPYNRNFRERCPFLR
jgi:hypothetical protein